MGLGIGLFGAVQAPTPAAAMPVLACALPVDGAFKSAAFELREVGGGALVRTQHGLFRYDAASNTLRAFGEVATGAVYAMVETPRGALIGGQNGLFHFDAVSAALRPVDTAQTGSVLNMALLPDGALIRADRGWFRYDAAKGSIRPAGQFAADARGGLHRVPGGVLINANTEWFLYDAASGTFQPSGVASTGEITATLDLPGGRLIGGTDGLFRYDFATASLGPAGGPRTGGVREMRQVPNDVLIGADEGLFLYEVSSGSVRSVGDPAMGGVLAMRGVPGGVLIAARGGLFHYNPVSGATRLPPAQEPTGLVFHMLEAPGSVLLWAVQGLFRYDLAEGSVHPMEVANTGAVLVSQAVPGGLLIGAEQGLFRYDSASGSIRAAREAQTGRVAALLDLDGPVLIAAIRGLFRQVARPPDSVTVLAVEPGTLDRSTPSTDRLRVTVGMRHECAPVAAGLGLTLVASHEGQEIERVPARLLGTASPGATDALLAGEFRFDRPGAWTLALRQGAMTLGQPLAFTVAAPTLWQRAALAWEWLLALGAALYAIAFATLLLAAHRSAAAFRLLADPAWGRWLGWPFFLLRHVPAVQRWVLEPWFQAVRATVRMDAAHLDPPVTNGTGPALPASTLMPLLATAPRLWLQGRSGMGKSSVFAAWERAYFADAAAPSLAAAGRRQGFVLILVPARHYADIAVPEPNRPESWVIECVRRRFEMFGLGEIEPGLVRAMLRGGGFAVALDGMNEVDRDASLAAFARQFPMVRLLVTSQTAAPEGWNGWRLPQDVAELRTGLLELWLGRHGAQMLDARIEAAGIGAVITSGYDLRLIAELVQDDPAAAPLPADRMGLYRAALARATDAAGEPLRLESLKQVAWAMMVARRRELSDEDRRVLTDPVIRALSREGVRILRQVGRTQEFRHDQMRAFLAASWLVDELPGAQAIQDAVEGGRAFSLSRRDQEDLWGFVAPLLPDHLVPALWRFASERPQDRGLLQAAVQAEAGKRGMTLTLEP